MSKNETTIALILIAAIFFSIIMMEGSAISAFRELDELKASCALKSPKPQEATMSEGVGG